MLKKFVIAGGALALLSSLSVGVPLWSYARCGIASVTGAAGDVVPVEWELKRARQMIGDLQPEIEANAKRIAREKVEVTRLAAQLDDTQQKLVRAKSDIARLHDDLQDGDTSYRYGARTYTSAQVRSDLGNRAKRYQVRQETATKLQQMLTAREASLRSAHEQMDAMLNARRELEVEVENLQARLASLRVEQTSNDMHLDDSMLSRTRQLLDEIATRLDVEEETNHVDAAYFGEIDLEAAQDENLDELVSAILSDDTTSPTELASTVRE